MDDLVPPGDKGSPQVSDTLSRRAFTGGQWRVASLGVQGVLHLVVGVVLARLLLPADFGLAALALIVIGFATMVGDVGVGAAVMQRLVVTTAHLRVAFTLSVLAGVVIAGALFGIAPLIAILAKSPAVTPVLRVQSIVFIATGVGTVARALLQRRLDFRRLFAVDLISYLLGYALIAIGGALLGFGVWSLVFGSLVQSWLASVLSAVSARAPVKPLIAKQEMRDLLGFGVGVTVNGVIAYVGRNGDNFLVGRFLGTTALGLYSRAFNFMMLPINYLTSVIPTILIPAFAEIQLDKARVGRGYLMGVQTAALITAPVMVWIIVSAPHLIIGVYGERWAGAVLPLQLLAAAGVPRAMLGLAGAVAQACNRVSSEMPLQIGFALAITIRGRGWFALRSPGSGGGRVDRHRVPVPRPVAARAVDHRRVLAGVCTRAPSGNPCRTRRGRRHTARAPGGRARRSVAFADSRAALGDECGGDLTRAAPDAGLGSSPRLVSAAQQAHSPLSGRNARAVASNPRVRGMSDRSRADG